MVSSQNAQTNPADRSQEATASFEKMHRQVQEQITHHQAELGHARNARDALIGKVEQGTLSPQQANNENRSLQKIIDQHQSSLEECQCLLKPKPPENKNIPAPSREIPSPHKKQKSALSTPDRSTLMLSAVIIAVAIAAIYRYHYQGEGVQFTLQPPSLKLQQAILQCTNKTKHPISLFVTENAPEHLEKPNQAHRIDLYLAHDNSNTFKLFPNTATHWSHNGVTLAQIGPIILQPGITTELKLDVAALRDQVDFPTEFRIKCIVADRTLAYITTF